MSKRKKTSTASPTDLSPSPATTEPAADNESITTRAAATPEVLEQPIGEGGPVEHDESTALASTLESAPHLDPEPRPALPTDPDAGMAEDLAVDSESIEFSLDAGEFDAEQTVNLVGDLPLPGRDDLDAETVTASGAAMDGVDRIILQRKHLRGLLEALVFASDSPIKPGELAKLAHAPIKQVREHLTELKQDYATRGMHLDEVAGGWVFRTSPQYAPFVRDLTKQKPVRLTRAQVETLAIIAYRQPMTRPEVDDVRGVDTGPVLKLLLERDLVRILGKRDEPGRPLIYGTTGHFLEFFGLKSLKDLPTLREFTELSDESRDTFEEELGESPEDAARRTIEAEARLAAGEGAGATPGELGEHEHELGEHEHTDGHGHDENPPDESVRVPFSEDALHDLDDDLEALEGEVESDEPHASDQDGPTLTSDAPTGEADS